MGIKSRITRMYRRHNISPGVPGALWGAVSVDGGEASKTSLSNICNHQQEKSESWMIESPDIVVCGPDIFGFFHLACS